MDISTVHKIKANPKYQKLVSSRSSLAWRLAIIMLIVYYSFILIIAFNPSLLGTPVSNGVTTVGIPVGIIIIIFAFILTGIYTNKANKEFDSLVSEIKEDLREGDN